MSTLLEIALPCVRVGARRVVATRSPSPGGARRRLGARLRRLPRACDYPDRTTAPLPRAPRRLPCRTRELPHGHPGARAVAPSPLCPPAVPRPHACHRGALPTTATCPCRHCAPSRYQAPPPATPRPSADARVTSRAPRAPCSPPRHCLRMKPAGVPPLPVSRACCACGR